MAKFRSRSPAGAQLSLATGFPKKGNMNNPEYLKLLETSWRRPLSAGETARLRTLLAQDPELKRAWETDAALTQTLRRLPHPPLASNFTAQVVAAARQSTSDAHAGRFGGWPWWRPFWPKLAYSALLVAVGVVSFRAYTTVRHARLVRDLASIPVVVKVPSPEVLQDFDAIQQFSQVALHPTDPRSISDEALLQALQ
jgi:anti-sigma factor RsiW